MSNIKEGSLELSTRLLVKDEEKNFKPRLFVNVEKGKAILNLVLKSGRDCAHTP